MPKGNEKLSELRCNNCNSLLAKANIKNGKVEIKCKCSSMNTFEAEENNRSEGMMKKEDLQLEMLKYGISLKSSAQLIARFKLNVI